MPLLGWCPTTNPLVLPHPGNHQPGSQWKVIVNEHRLSNRVEDIIASSLVDIDSSIRSQHPPGGEL